MSARWPIARRAATGPGGVMIGPVGEGKTGVAGETDSSAFPARPWPDVPVELAEVLRPHLDEVADDMIVEIQAKVREYDRPGHAPSSAPRRLAVERVLQYFVDRITAPEREQDS